MTRQKELYFQDNLNVIKDIDEGMMNVDAYKKWIIAIYGCNVPKEEEAY